MYIRVWKFPRSVSRVRHVTPRTSAPDAVLANAAAMVGQRSSFVCQKYTIRSRISFHHLHVSNSSLRHLLMVFVVSNSTKPKPKHKHVKIKTGCIKNTISQVYCIHHATNLYPSCAQNPQASLAKTEHTQTQPNRAPIKCRSTKCRHSAGQHHQQPGAARESIGHTDHRHGQHRLPLGRFVARTIG